MTTTEATPAVQKFMSNTGVRIYRIPMEVFEGFMGYSYVLLGAGVPTIVDSGSGFEKSNAMLDAGLSSIHNVYGEDFRATDIERIILSHGHIDHFGGLPHLLEITDGARVGVHPLDRRILTNYDERRTIATKDLTIFLERSGVREKRITELIEMYNFSKQLFKSVDVQFMVDEDMQLDGMTFMHVPGHCSGQVAIRIGDILLTADHVLSRTSPHVASESITNYTGLGHYRDSLRKMRKLDGVRLALAGHEDVIEDFHARVDAIQTRIDEKLHLIMDIINVSDEPLSVVEVSKRRYKGISGFDVLLALQEAGAYMEYLYDRGYLMIANFADVEHEYNPVVKYNVIKGAILNL